MKSVLEKNLKIIGCSKYNINENGDVYSLFIRGFVRTTPKKLKQFKNNNGYYQVYLMTDDNKQKWFRVHRLVAEVFIPNPENKPYVDHINGNREDNSIDNLRWCTQKENCNNPISINRYKNCKKNNKEIEQYNKCYELLGVYKSISEASKLLNIKACNIVNNLKCRQKTAGGFIWKYK